MSTSSVLLSATFEKFLKNQSDHDITFCSNGYLKEKSVYKINSENLNRLGEGTFGEVFKVRVSKSFTGYVEPEIQAIKKVGIIYSEEIKLYEMFRDFLTLINVNDERVVKCFDSWFEIDNHLNELFLFVRTEFCDGNLKESIEIIQNNPVMKGKHYLTLSGYCLASDILIEILEGVNYLHKRNPKLIHGNLKPENILFKKVNNSMYIKIADTGFRTIEECSLKRKIIEREEIYSAPEVLNAAHFETKSDIFSLGIITKELFDINLKK
jgi:serine/threonine protein kinase